MSVFSVSDTHISALVRFVFRGFRSGAYWSFPRYNPSTGEDYTEDEIGTLLRNANDASYRARYAHDAEVRNAPPAVYRYRAPRRDYSPVEIIRAVECFRYQACEWEKWEGSDADRLSKEILDHAIQSLPGYQEAAWAIPHD